MEQNSFIINFVYPAFLILISAGFTRILIPMYSNMQKQKELKIPLKHELLNLFYATFRDAYAKHISIIREIQDEFEMPGIDHDGSISESVDKIQMYIDNHKIDEKFFTNNKHFNEFQESLLEPRKNYFLFKSKLYNYTEDRNLTDECIVLGKKSIEVSNDVSSLFQPQNLSNLACNLDDISKKLRENDDAFNKYAVKLRDCKIKKIII